MLKRCVFSDLSPVLFTLYKCTSPGPSHAAAALFPQCEAQYAVCIRQCLGANPTKPAWPAPTPFSSHQALIMHLVHAFVVAVTITALCAGTTDTSAAEQWGASLSAGILGTYARSSFSLVKAKYGNVSYISRRRDGAGLATALAENLVVKMSKTVDALRRTVSNAQVAYALGAASCKSLKQCCKVSARETAYSPAFKTGVDKSTVCCCASFSYIRACRGSPRSCILLL